MSDLERKSSVFLVGETRRAELLRVLLRKVPRFDCAGAFSCVQGALAAMDANPPDAMLVLIDGTGPWTTELVDRIRKQRPDLAIIVCLGSRAHGDVLQALAPGANSILIEPIRRHELAIALESATRGGSFLCAKTRNQLASAMCTQRVELTTGISRRQADVIERLLQGLSDKVIASQLGVAESTIRTHLRALYRRLDVHTRGAARAKLLGFDPLKELHVDRRAVLRVQMGPWPDNGTCHGLRSVLSKHDIRLRAALAFNPVVGATQGFGGQRRGEPGESKERAVSCWRRR